MRPTRHAFRPLLSDVLEERVVLSRAGVVAAAVHATAERPLPTLRNTPPVFGPIGVLGDSYSDEYRDYRGGRDQARNWVETLHALRQVKFGPFSLRSRGEPRNTGFLYDWARSDSTSVNLVNNQLPGLTAQVAAGQIRYAVVFTGGNDFLFFLRDAVSGRVAPADLSSRLAQVTATAVRNAQTAVTTLLAANAQVKVAVVTIDVTTLPVVRLAALTPQGPALVEAVRQAQGQYNAALKAMSASSSRVALVDLAAQTAQLASVPGGVVPFGGTTIRLNTLGTGVRDFFLPDGIHPGTVGQGLIANAIVQALDTKFGAGIMPLSPVELVRYAHRVNSGAGFRIL